MYNGTSMDAPLSTCALQCTIFIHFFLISLWQFIFFHVGLFSCCTLFSFHFCHTAPFPCCTFSCNNLFMLHLFFLLHSSFMYCSISCCTFTSCHVFVLHFLLLHSSHVAIFSCCTLFMLHYFQRCSLEQHKRVRWGALQQ